MDLSNALIIAALIAVGRWVLRSLKEPVTELPDVDAKTGAQRPAKPGQKSFSIAIPKTGQKHNAISRRTSTAARHADVAPVWNVVLDLPQDAPRSEIQAAAKRRIAQALSNGDHAAVAHITRAAATGLKHRVLRSADASPRHKRDP